VQPDVREPFREIHGRRMTNQLTISAAGGTARTASIVMRSISLIPNDIAPTPALPSDRNSKRNELTTTRRLRRSQAKIQAPETSRTRANDHD
jgi:hypothetical protein